MSFVTIVAVDHNVFGKAADIRVSIHTEDASVEVKPTLGDFGLEQGQVDVSSNVVASIATTPLVSCFLRGASNNVRKPECCRLLFVASADLLLIVGAIDSHLAFVHDDDLAAGDGECDEQSWSPPPRPTHPG